MSDLAWLDEIEKRAQAVTPRRVRAVTPSTSLAVAQPALVDGNGLVAWCRNSMDGWRDALLIEALWNERERLCRAVRDLYEELSRLVAEVKRDQEYGWHNASTYDAEKVLERWKRGGSKEA